MSMEGTEFDRKSLRLLTKANPDWDELACDCVAFATARGGKLLIGIEDDADEPPAGQRVQDDLVERISKRIPQITLNVGVLPKKLTAKNGGEYIEVEVFRNGQTVASTSDGRYFLRVADESRPLLPDELTRLMNDKTAYAWETGVGRQVPRTQVDGDKLDAFVAGIQASERVSDFVKGKTVDELLDYYLLVDGEHLTNLGVFWIGRREDRARLAYAPVVQFIKYDEQERKVNKLVWDDFSLNPLELIEAVWNEIPDWRESYELPDGLLRKTVPQYDEVVVRELVANALVHRPYTQRGDIFLNLYPDRLEVHNPGLLPLGVTPANILHTSVKRNEHLAHVFYDLQLMEREGSGYDRMYEVLVSSGRCVPEVVEGNDRVAVTIRKRIIDAHIVDFMGKADEALDLTQKERITLGVLAQHKAVTATNLCRILELDNAGVLKPWLQRLLDWEVVRTRGRTRGTEYFVDPDLLRKLDFKGATTLKGIETHRLRELILADLRTHGPSKMGEIHERIGPEIPRRKVRHQIHVLVQDGLVESEGKTRAAVYNLTERA